VVVSVRPATPAEVICHNLSKEIRQEVLDRAKSGQTWGKGPDLVNDVIAKKIDDIVKGK
jgi:hypothetical protein